MPFKIQRKELLVLLRAAGRSASGGAPACAASSAASSLPKKNRLHLQLKKYYSLYGGACAMCCRLHSSLPGRPADVRDALGLDDVLAWLRGVYDGS